MGRLCWEPRASYSGLQLGVIKQGAGTSRRLGLLFPQGRLHVSPGGPAGLSDSPQNRQGSLVNKNKPVYLLPAECREKGRVPGRGSRLWDLLLSRWVLQQHLHPGQVQPLPPHLSGLQIKLVEYWRAEGPPTPHRCAYEQSFCPGD